MSQDFKSAFQTSLPVLTSYVVLGIGFGILLEANGYNFIWAFIMSVCIYAGSLQYLGIGLMASHAPFLTTLFMSLVVNARHLFYSISMIEKYKDTKGYKPYLIFGLTDETYSLLCNKNRSKEFYFYLTLLNHSYWIIGSVIGGIVGELFSFNSYGIDFSMTALFITVVLDQWETMKNHIPCLVGFACSIGSLLVFGLESFLIPSMIGIICCLFILRKKIEGDLHDG
ncbi:MAG: AzlC family ABC transporter permease [Holdemanella sp.]|nr:AzlC family ABC transporter permease [Holdemanella sp.]